MKTFQILEAYKFVLMLQLQISDQLNKNSQYLL